MDFLDPFLAATLRNATPLLLAAMGELILERGGVLNIGIEGVMLFGAFFGFLAAWATGSPACGAAAAMLAGALLAAVLAGMVLRLKADQIVVGMALNLVALGVTGTFNSALQRWLRAQGRPAQPSAPTFEPLLPAIGALGEQTLLTWAALLAVPCVWYYLNRSERGLELRGVGENPAAAEASGIHVAACRFKACLAAGVLGGLGGGFLTISQAASFAPNTTSGRGFVALAAVVLGRYGAWGTAAACVFFGAAFSARNRFLAAGWRIHPEQLEMLPYLLTLAALAFTLQKRSGAPAGLGKP